MLDFSHASLFIFQKPSLFCMVVISTFLPVSLNPIPIPTLTRAPAWVQGSLSLQDLLCHQDEMAFIPINTKIGYNMVVHFFLWFTFPFDKLHYCFWKSNLQSEKLKKSSENFCLVAFNCPLCLRLLWLLCPFVQETSGRSISELVTLGCAVIFLTEAEMGICAGHFWKKNNLRWNI